MASLSVLIPTLNAVPLLAKCLDALAGVDVIVVADGGSIDGTQAAARLRGAQVIETARGRGTQLAAAARHADTPWLLFLHADTVLQPGWRHEAGAFMQRADTARRAAAFRFALDDASPAARRLETAVALRCRMLALPYGDQGLLISRQLYDCVGGYRDLPIMEDVDIVRRIGRARLEMLQTRAVTSADRWRRDGWFRRSARNAGCLALYGAGVPPRLIAKAYGA